MVEAELLVIGGGAIGGVTAARMAGAVRRVVVLDTNQDHVARMRDPGLIWAEPDGKRTVSLDALTDAQGLEGEFDFALIAVKAPHHRAALGPVVAGGRVKAFASLGNGLIHEGLAELVGAERLLACLVEWGGTNVGPGRLVRDTVAPMVVGELDGAERERADLLARCLAAVGETRVTQNIRGQIWSKLLVNTAFTGLSAVSGLRYGEVAAHPDGREAAYAVWAEGVKVGEAEGLALDAVLDVEPHELVVGSDSDRTIASAALERMMSVAGRTKPSMLQDLEQGRVTEVDVVNGGVAARGRAHAIATPFNDRVVDLVHQMERGERSPAPEVLGELLRASEHLEGRLA